MMHRVMLAIVGVLMLGCRTSQNPGQSGTVAPSCAVTSDCPPNWTCWTAGHCAPDPPVPCDASSCPPGTFCLSDLKSYCPECKNSSGCIPQPGDGGYSSDAAVGTDGPQGEVGHMGSLPPNT
jgi:hypothetical protein